MRCRQFGGEYVRDIEGFILVTWQVRELQKVKLYETFSLIVFRKQLSFSAAQGVVFAMTREFW